MAVSLNHTIVPATDKRASADFLRRILGLLEPTPWGPFLVVPVGNGVSLDFMDAHGFQEHHYAFLVDETEFDPIFERIRTAGAAYYADPMTTARATTPPTASDAAGASNASITARPASEPTSTAVITPTMPAMVRKPWK